MYYSLVRVPRSSFVSLKLLLSTVSSNGTTIVKKSNREHVFALLGLKKFDEQEILESYNRLKTDTASENIIVEHGLQKIIANNEYSHKLTAAKVTEISKLITGGNTLTQDLTFIDYSRNIRKLGEQLDTRVWNIGFSFLLAGMSIGIIIPCMPLVVHQLNIPSYQFGIIVSAFALSKLFGNIPAGCFVDIYGRKPIMLGGMGMCALGIGSIGLALLPGFGSSWLVACRLLTGFGVSGFTAGGFMYISDISTALNRTRTIAPVMASFSAGTALGPAIGGFLIESVGIMNTYAIVGGMMSLQVLVNYGLLTETMDPKSISQQLPSSETLSQPTTSQPISNAPVPSKNLSSVVQTTFKEWRILWKESKIANLVILNSAFWFAYSGSQMTLLPLLMVSPTFSLSAYEIGGCFALMSATSFLASQPVAYVADKFGKISTIVTGCGLITASLLCVPFAGNVTQLVMTLFPMAMGSTALNSVPTSLISDWTSSSKRAQGLSLLRTAGDVGLFTGALFSGLVATQTSIETSLLVNGGILSSTIAWYLYSIYRTEPLEMPPKQEIKIDLPTKDEVPHNAADESHHIDSKIKH